VTTKEKASNFRKCWQNRKCFIAPMCNALNSNIAKAGKL